MSNHKLVHLGHRINNSSQPLLHEFTLCHKTCKNMQWAPYEAITCFTCLHNELKQHQGCYVIGVA
jgi:hypothetical protein